MRRMTREISKFRFHKEVAVLLNSSRDEAAL